MRKIIKQSDLKAMGLTEDEMLLFKFEAEEINDSKNPCPSSVLFFEYVGRTFIYGRCKRSAYSKAVKHFALQFVKKHGGHASFKECCIFVADKFRASHFNLARYMRGMFYNDATLIISEAYGLDSIDLNTK